MKPERIKRLSDYYPLTPWFIDSNVAGGINKVVADIGSATRNVIISDAQTLTANLTIPSNISLTILKGGSIAKASTYTLTINGPFSAGLYQAFSGFSAGDVTFGSGSVKEVLPDWWGVAKDGTTDDSGAIRSAISAATGPKRVYITAGTYAIESAITITAGDIAIVGVGPNRTLLSKTGDTNDVLYVSGEVSRVKIEDLWIGSFAARTSGHGLRVAGTGASDPADNIHIRNITIQNVPTPLRLQYVHQSSLQNILIRFSIASAVTSEAAIFDTVVATRIDRVLVVPTSQTFPSYGIRFINDCDTIVATHLEVVLGVTSAGIALQNLTGSTGPRLMRISDSFVENGSDDGWLIAGGRDIRISRGQSAGNTLRGFNITGGTTVILDNCYSIQNGSHGFHVQGGSGNAILNSTASNNSQTTTASADGIRIENNVTNTRIIGNRSGDYVLSLTNVQRYGLSIAATGTDYITAYANDLSANGTAPILNGSPGLNNNIEEVTGSFTGTLTGCTTSPTGGISASISGRIVTLKFPNIQATSNTTAATITGGTAKMQPATAKNVIARIVDNGTTAFGIITVETSGVLTLKTGADGGSFTGSGTKGIAASTITYSLD